MPKTAITRSDILEQEYESGASMLLRATILLVGSLLLVYVFGRLIPGSSFFYTLMKVCGVFGALGAIVLMVIGGTRMQRARTSPTVAVACPYCDFPVQFPKEPTVDWDCEGCHRRVQYENGVQVPIKLITCTFCKTVHRVSSRARQFTCDKCNRALKLTDKPDASALGSERSDVMRNYDLLLTDTGRNRNEVALHLQDLLVCNLPEARRQMENLPLTVLRNVPERKADAERRRLRELGASCVVRPTSADQPAGRT